MRKVLRKRLPREIKANLFRYVSLFIMIALCMYIVISLVDAAEIIIRGTEQNQKESNLEDGQITVFYPLTDDQTARIENKGVTIEEHFSYDIKMDDGSNLRIFKNREKIDLVVLDKYGVNNSNKSYGTAPGLAAGPNEAVLEKRYCEEHGISVGDLIKIGKEEYLVTGIGSSADYDAPYRKLADTAVDSSVFGTAFVEEREYYRIKDMNETGTEEFTYAFVLNDAMSAADLKQMIRDFDQDLTKAGIPGNMLEFMLRADNLRIGGAAGDIEINKMIGIVAGIIVIILFTYVLSVFVIHQIQSESSVIGALYALGVRKKDLMKHYITLPTVISFLGGLTGAIVGFSGLGSSWQMSDSYEYYSLPWFERVIPPYLVVYAVVMPPVVSLLVNWLVINKSLSRTTLSLIRNEQKISSHSSIRLGNMSFIGKFRIRQMLREKRTAFTIIAGMMIALLIFTMGMDCYVLCESVGRLSIEDTRYEYLYSLKYPDKEVPEGGEAVLVKTLKKDKFGYTLDITVMGIDDDNPYVNVRPVKGIDRIVASDAVTLRYGLKKGDKLVLSDNADDIDYEFTIADIAPYSVGLTVFMDIDDMRELFGEEDDYYNVVMAGHELDIDAGRIYSTTTKKDVDRSSDIFLDLMRPMYTMLLGMSAVIFCIVMYLMMTVMIDRAGFGISLVKIFGYKNRDVKKLYLNGNRIVVIIGALIGIPVAKLIIDTIFPIFIANVACTVHLEYRWYHYAILFAGIMLCYRLIITLLAGKLNRITPAEVLKNRE